MSDASTSVIPSDWDIPDGIRSRVGDGAGRQRALAEEGHLLLILRELPSAIETVRVAKVFWRTPNGIWRADVAGRPGGFEVLQEHLQAFHRILQALDTRVDASASAQDFFAVLQYATPLSRAARNLHRALQEARDAIHERELITLRDTAGELERLAELVVLDAQNGLGYTAARNAEEQARNGQRALDAQHKLNILAALFFPATAIGSILGTNLQSGLEHEATLLFWFIFLAAFAVGVGTVRWLTRTS